MTTRSILLVIFTLFIFSTAVGAEKHSILILYYKSNFKEQVKDHLLRRFDAEQTEVTVAELKKWEEYPAARYDAVILMSGVTAGNPYKDGARYIKANGYSKNIIYLSSSKKRKAAYGSRIDPDKIDAITCASKKAEAKEAADKIYIKTLELIPEDAE